MIPYLVTCALGHQMETVGEIIDARAEGRGVKAEDFRNHGIPLTPRNRRGSRRLVVFRCPQCRKPAPPLADTTIAEVLDVLEAKHADELANVTLPVEGLHPEVDHFELLTGATEGRWVVVGQQDWRLVSLRVLCKAVSEIRDRRRG